MRNRAAYRVLADSIRADVLEGRYASGDRLPTEVELEGQLDLSRQTVRRAYQDLVAEGLVYRVPGRGTFVADQEGMYVRHFGSIDDLLALSSDTQMRVTRPLTRRVNVQAAGRLRMPTDIVGVVEFVRLHEESPFCLTEVFLPPEGESLLRDVPELQESGATSSITVIGLLDRKLPNGIVEAEQSVTASPAPSEICSVLGVAVGAPVLRIDRLYFTDDSRPVELAVSYFRPDLYSYRLRLRRAGA